MVELLFQLLPVLFLIALGFGCGSLAERRHISRLNRRERDNGDFLITQIKTFPNHAAGQAAPQMIIAETVIASDYFKTFLAGLRRLFGGEVRSFHSLLSRARREATQRVVEQARKMGYDAICNLRIETADIGGSTGRRRAAMVAILASATAYNQQTSDRSFAQSSESGQHES